MSVLRKEKSRYAARNRRNNENMQYEKLAKLLPLAHNVTSQLDKASIIRLTSSFLRYKGLATTDYITESKSKFKISHLETLDGFLFVLSQDGHFIYVSESICKYIGLLQIDLMGASIYNYIHPDDQNKISELLSKQHKRYSDGIPFETQVADSAGSFISTMVRMKCGCEKKGSYLDKKNRFKAINICGNTIPYRYPDKKSKRLFALVATGQLLIAPNICELKLDTKVFVSRVGMDLKISFCEGNIHKYMDFTARDIVGVSAYDFYHSKDMVVVQAAHLDCLGVGKCVSGLYRWMNKLGGWLHMRTIGTVIKRKTPKGEESEILCVNYIYSEVEHRHDVTHSIQQRYKKMEGKSTRQTDSDMNTLLSNDYELCVNEDGTKHSKVKEPESVDCNEISTAIDKDTLILAIDNAARSTNESSTVACIDNSEFTPYPVDNCNNGEELQLPPNVLSSSACIEDLIESPDFDLTNTDCAMLNNAQPSMWSYTNELLSSLSTNDLNYPQMNIYQSLNDLSLSASTSMHSSPLTSSHCEFNNSEVATVHAPTATSNSLFQQQQLQHGNDIYESKSGLFPDSLSSTAISYTVVSTTQLSKQNLQPSFSWNETCSHSDETANQVNPINFYPQEQCHSSHPFQQQNPPRPQQQQWQYQQQQLQHQQSQQQSPPHQQTQQLSLLHQQSLQDQQTHQQSLQDQQQHQLKDLQYRQHFHLQQVPSQNLKNLHQQHFSFAKTAS